MGCFWLMILSKLAEVIGVVAATIIIARFSPGLSSFATSVTSDRFVVIFAVPPFAVPLFRFIRDFRSLREKKKKTINKKTHKQNFHGIVPGLSRGLSRPFPEISWEFCLCVSLLPQERGKHINNLTPTHFRDNPAKCLCLLVFCPPEIFSSTQNQIKKNVRRCGCRSNPDPDVMDPLQDDLQWD